MSDDTSNTLVNAVVGAVVTVVLSFLAFSPIVGGAVAGYLERRDGLRVGAISGAIAAIPLVTLAFLFVGFFGFFATGAPGFFVFFAAIALPFGLLYSIGLSALGGYVGVYLADEFRDDLDRPSARSPHDRR
ncbi:DUF5518 domain-containing protein [Natribaculum luteum]|uniref:DUF5518 domain-containing protein n=1 Tax=Natribaculum luteum TaxID=1586232 RepID=A0ABD5P1U6_9EURY|nr:DUF5518 domain-containing protein [Natribaculum luteum]